METIDFNNVQVLAGTISGFVIGLTSLLKQAGINSRFLPIISMVMGIGLSVLVVGVSATAVFVGITASFLANGIYSSVKATTKQSTDEFSG